MPKSERVKPGSYSDLLCSFPGCTNRARSKFLCGAHRRQQTKGEELRPLRPASYMVEQVCSFPDCKSPATAKFLCGAHRRQQLKGQELQPLRQSLKGKICSFPGCETRASAKSLCNNHRRQQLNGEELRPLRQSLKGKVCSFPGCERAVRSTIFCGGHYSQHVRGTKLRPLRPKPSGDGFITASGYKVLSLTIDGKRQQRPEHRLVMEELIGRPLRREESVHHINGLRADNRPENLELWSSSHPQGQRVEDKVVWAKEILALYEPTKTPKRKRKPRK